MVWMDGGRVLKRTSSAIIDGTVLMSVTPGTEWGVAKLNTLSARITLPPEVSGANNSKIERSKQIEVAASTPLNSSAPKTERAHAKKAPALWCSIMTPLGFPVDPEV